MPSWLQSDGNRAARVFLFLSDHIDPPSDVLDGLGILKTAETLPVIPVKFQIAIRDHPGFDF